MRNHKVFSKNTIALILIILTGSLLFCPEMSARDGADAPESEEWSMMESNFFIVYYSPDANLEDMERELKKRPLYFDQPARYGETTTSGEICERLDRLFNHVRDVIDMHPKMPKIEIKIFKDRYALDDECFKVFGKREELKSFYVYDRNTIYTSESDIEDSIMAHEMAHAVIDHYFSVIPPETVREILASYVDAHLES